MQGLRFAVALASFLQSASLLGCRATSHPVVPAKLAGVARSGAELERSLLEPGPLSVETVVSADWVVVRSGLVDLDHPEAKAAGLRDGDEPIQIVFHALRH